MMIVGSFGAVADNHDDGVAPHGDLTLDTPATITISGLTDGDTVNLYKVLEWSPNAAWSVGGWIPTSGFDGVLTSAAWANLIDKGEDDYTGITSKLAGDLSRATNKARVLVDENGAVSGGAYSKSGLAAGLYMAIVKPYDVNTVYNPVFVSIDYADNGTNGWIVNSSASYSQVNNAKGAAKKSTLKLEKTAKSADDYDGDDGASADVGDTLTFTVKTTIPGYGLTFEHPKFILRDVMDKLALSQDTVSGIAFG